MLKKVQNNVIKLLSRTVFEVTSAMCQNRGYQRLACCCSYWNQELYYVLTVMKSFVSFHSKKLYFISKNSWDVAYVRLLLNFIILYMDFFLTNRIVSCLSVYAVVLAEISKARVSTG